LVKSAAISARPLISGVRIPSCTLGLETMMVFFPLLMHLLTITLPAQAILAEKAQPSKSKASIRSERSSVVDAHGSMQGTTHPSQLLKSTADCTRLTAASTERNVNSLCSRRSTDLDACSTFYGTEQGEGGTVKTQCSVQTVTVDEKEVARCRPAGECRDQPFLRPHFNISTDGSVFFHATIPTLVFREYTDKSCKGNPDLVYSSMGTARHFERCMALDVFSQSLWATSLLQISSATKLQHRKINVSTQMLETSSTDTVLPFHREHAARRSGGSTQLEIKNAEKGAARASLSAMENKIYAGNSQDPAPTHMVLSCDSLRANYVELCFDSACQSCERHRTVSAGECGDSLTRTGHKATWLGCA